MIRGLLAALALSHAAGCSSEVSQQSDQPQRREQLQILTALPLAWSTDFGLSQPGSAALERLGQRYEIGLVDLPTQLAPKGLLLAAQPRALPAEQLVALDRWVREGGRVLLLADPMLAWPDPRPLGDPTRPPRSFADTGLLIHWGLRLDSPERLGETDRSLNGLEVITVSPGRLVGRCVGGEDGLVARCRVGKGHAVVIADADWIDVDRLGSRAAANLDALMTELKLLEDQR